MTFWAKKNSNPKNILTFMDKNIWIPSKKSKMGYTTINMVNFSQIGPLKEKKNSKKWKKMTPTKIFKLRFLWPGKGSRPPLKGYLSKITYIFGRNDNFWKFSKFELSRSNFPRKTHFLGTSCVALFWPTIFLASPDGEKITLFY